MDPRVAIARDLLAIVLGAFGFAFEVVSGGERVWILAASLALMQLPFYLPDGLRDLARKRRNGNDQ